MSKFNGIGQGPDPDGTGLEPPAPVFVAPPGFVGPVDPALTGGAPVAYPASQAQIAALQSQLNALPTAAAASSSFSSWMNQNGTTVLLIGSAFVVLMLLSKRR